MADSYLPPVIASLLADVSDFVENWQAAAEAAQEAAAEIAAAQEAASGGPAGTADGSNEAALATAAQEAAAAEQELGAAAAEASTAVEEEGAAADVAAGNTAQLGGDAENAAGSMGVFTSETDGAATAAAEFATEADDAATAVEEEGTAVADTATDLAGYTAATQAATAASTSFGNGALIVGSSLEEANRGLVSMRPGFDEFGRALNQSGADMRTMIGQSGEAQTSLEQLRRSFDDTGPPARALGDSAAQAGRSVAQAGKDAEEGAAGVTRSGEAAHEADKGWVGLFEHLTHGPDVIDGITAAVGAAVPVLTGMALGLTAFATGAGVALLGLDGLEQAANQLDAALGPLKEAASQAFEKTLFPAITEVSKAVPEMRQSVTDAATAIGGMLKSIADIATSGQGIQDLNQWLQGTADFFNEGKRGAEQFSEAVLTFLAAAAPAMKEFGSDFADVEQDWNKLIQTAAQTGEITKAVEGAGAAFKGFMEMVSRVVDAMMKLSADVGPQVGDMFKNIGDAIEAIEPPISVFIKGFTTGIDVIAQIVKAAEGMVEPFSAISGLLAALAIGFKVFEWVLAPITQTIKLLRLLWTTMADAEGAKILLLKFTDALSITEGAAAKAQKANLSATETMKLEGEAAEKAAAKNALFTDSLKVKGDAAEKAAAKIGIMTDALKVEGNAAEGAAAKNALFDASAEAGAPKVAEAGAAASGLAGGLGKVAPAGEEAAAGMAEAGGEKGALGLLGALASLQPEIALSIAAVAALAVAGVAVVRNWPQISETIKQVGHDIMQQLQTWPQETGKELGDVAATFYNAGKAINQDMMDLYQNINSVNKNIVSSLQQAGRDIANNFPKSFDQVKQNVEASWHDLENFFTHSVPDLVGGLINGIKDAASSVGDAFGTLWDSAKKEFDQKAGIASPSTVMAAAGKDIVDGLTQGIEQGKSSAINAVVQWAEALLQSVKSALGISSPSAEFHSVGLFMMEGWESGIIAGAGKVTDAVRKVSQNALSAARQGGDVAASGAMDGAALISGSGAGAGSGAIQVTVHVQGDDSGMAAVIQGMFRKGQIKISANSIVRGRANA